MFSSTMFIGGCFMDPPLGELNPLDLFVFCTVLEIKNSKTYCVRQGVHLYVVCSFQWDNTPQWLKVDLQHSWKWQKATEFLQQAMSWFPSETASNRQYNFWGAPWKCNKVLILWTLSEQLLDIRFCSANTGFPRNSKGNLSNNLSNV